MTRQLNPFVYGNPVPPTHFIGRENIITNCYNKLAGPVRTSIAISGEHGIGKTSLLHYLIYIAQQKQFDLFSPFFLRQSYALAQKKGERRSSSFSRASYQKRSGRITTGVTGNSIKLSMDKHGQAKWISR